MSHVCLILRRSTFSQNILDETRSIYTQRCKNINAIIVYSHSFKLDREVGELLFKNTTNETNVRRFIRSDDYTFYFCRVEHFILRSEFQFVFNEQRIESLFPR